MIDCNNLTVLNGSPEEERKTFRTRKHCYIRMCLLYQWMNYRKCLLVFGTKLNSKCGNCAYHHTKCITLLILKPRIFAVENHQNFPSALSIIWLITFIKHTCSFKNRRAPLSSTLSFIPVMNYNIAATNKKLCLVIQGLPNSNKRLLCTAQLISLSAVNFCAVFWIFLEKIPDMRIFNLCIYLFYC